MRLHAHTKRLPEEGMRKLELREWDSKEVEYYSELLGEHHYLGGPDARKRHLCQVTLYEGAGMALLTWTTACAKPAGRETYIGWDDRTRQKRLGWLVQNNCFLLLPVQRPANLANRISGMAVKALPEAWETRFGKRPLLAETCVDSEG